MPEPVDMYLPPKTPSLVIPDKNMQGVLIRSSVRAVRIPLSMAFMKVPQFLRRDYLIRPK